MKGWEKWKRRGTYRSKGPRQELFRALWETRLQAGESRSKSRRLRCLYSLAAAAVSDDREGQKSRGPDPTSRVKSKKQRKSYSQGLERAGRRPAPCPAGSHAAGEMTRPGSLNRTGTPTGPDPCQKERPAREGPGEKTSGAKLNRHLFGGRTCRILILLSKTRAIFALAGDGDDLNKRPRAGLLRRDFRPPPCLPPHSCVR
jgi:hypothetical protein